MAADDAARASAAAADAEVEALRADVERRAESGTWSSSGSCVSTVTRRRCLMLGERRGSTWGGWRVALRGFCLGCVPEEPPPPASALPASGAGVRGGGGRGGAVRRPVLGPLPGSLLLDDSGGGGGGGGGGVGGGGGGSGGGGGGGGSGGGSGGEPAAAAVRNTGLSRRPYLCAGAPLLGGRGDVACATGGSSPARCPSVTVSHPSPPPRYATPCLRVSVTCPPTPAPTLAALRQGQDVSRCCTALTRAWRGTTELRCTVLAYATQVRPCWGGGGTLRARLGGHRLRAAHL